MTDKQAIELLEQALNDLKAGDESAEATLMRALDALGIDIGGDRISVGNISDATGVAIGRNIQTVITHAALSNELETKLMHLLDELTHRDVVSARRHIRIFLSSPSDVQEERALAMRVIEKLPYDPLLRGRVTCEPIAWDRTEAGMPMPASMTPQQAIDQNLPRPSECDIMIVIFWSRMGTPLSEDYHKPEAYQFPTGDDWEDWRYQSGAEWEYIDAMEAARQTGRPLVMVYRRTEEPKIGLRDPDFNEKLAQYRRVETFFATFKYPDGTVKHGINFYESPSDFERRFAEHLRDLIAQLLSEMEDEEASIEEEEEIELWEGSPFPGLRAFGPEDAPIFFGRGPETDDLVERLRESRFVAVVGASGSGKSSLVGAGLISRLADNAIPGGKDWALVRFTPDELGGGDPFAALTAALKRDPLHIEEKYLADHLRANPAALVELCEAALAGRPDWAEVLLFVDQFEELFTRASKDARAFVAMLEVAAASERIRVIVTLRGDFYNRALDFPALENLIKPGTYPLYAPKRDALREMIERPAERAGLRFEAGLVRRILDDTGDDPGALALMAFALQQLYDGRTPDGQLTHTAYESFGGVQGAIGAQAQAAFDELDESAREALPAVFRELVEVSEAGTPTRRRADWRSVARDPACEGLANKLTEKRLLTQSQGESGAPTVEVAHEALFRNWERLARWIAEMGEDLAYGGALEKDALEWEQNDRHPDFLLHGARLELAREWLIRAGANDIVNARQYEFVEESRAAWERAQVEEEMRHKREVRRLQFFVGGLAILAIVAVFFGWRSIQKADEAETAQFEAEQSAQEAEDLANQLAAAVQPEQLAEILTLEQLAEILAPEQLAEILAPEQFIEIFGQPETNGDWTPYIQGFNGLEMALVPAGCFMMGSENGDIDEKPIHEICFDNPFWIGVYEVTNEQYGAASGEYLSYSSEGNQPVIGVTWFESVAFCESQGMHLPTEAEWEYAARGPDALVYPWGNDFNGTLVNFCDETCTNDWADKNVDDGYQNTAPVGAYRGGISWVGAYDLSGNVWEWVNDLYGSDYYAGSPVINPQGPGSGEYRVLRGGSWDDSGVRAAYRSRNHHSIERNFLGFRCALSY